MSSKAISSAATKGKDPRKPSPSTKPTSISSLPDDLLLNCLARVSRLYHRRLSLVCKKFRSIVASPEIYKTRLLLNCTERCLYLCLRFQFEPTRDWLTLSKSIKVNVPSTSTGNLFVPIPSTEYPSAKPANIISIGSDIYQIGGHLYEYPDTRVSILDTKSHKWSPAPRMRVERSFSTSSVVDGKIYVAVGSKYGDGALEWVEIFDPKTQTWSSVKTPVIEREQPVYDEDGNRYGRVYGRVFRSFGLEGKFYFFGDENLVYDPKEDKWSSLGKDVLMSDVANPNRNDTTSYCVIGDILFFYEEGVFKWYDLKVSLWKELKGLEGLPNIGQRGLAKMADLDGKMAVLWFEYGYISDELQAYQIWCAEVSLERREGDEIWGKVEWFHEVAIVHDSCDISGMDVLSATV